MNEKDLALKEMIVKNLAQNGFPMKKVSLPLEKMYEVADNKGANLNVILEDLKDQGTIHEKIDDKIIFSVGKPDNMSSEDMMGQAREMMENMDPDELKKIQDMISNMSPEEQANLMEKARKMGINP